jgi:ribosomal-protein-alanine N-acetyltransferase
MVHGATRQQKMNLEAVHNHFPQLETERLILRRIQPDDAAAVYRIFSDPEVLHYYDISAYTSIDQAHKLIKRLDTRLEQRTGIRWGITLRGEDVVIGTFGFGWTQHNHQGEIGYDLARDYWQQGIMSEALTAAIRFGFEVAKLNRIQAHVIPGNIASEKLLLKHGFTREGLLREYGFFRGAYHDLTSFALLKKDYRSRA